MTAARFCRCVACFCICRHNFPVTFENQTNRISPFPSGSLAQAFTHDLFHSCPNCIRKLVQKRGQSPATTFIQKWLDRVYRAINNRLWITLEPVWIQIFWRGQESIWKARLFSSLWISPQLNWFLSSLWTKIDDPLSCLASSFGSDGVFHRPLQEIIIVSKLLFRPRLLLAWVVYKMF